MRRNRPIQSGPDLTRSIEKAERIFREEFGPARARALGRLALRRYGDPLRHYPNRYEHYPAPRPATELLFLQKASFEGVVKDVQTVVLNRGLRKITARLTDPTGQVTATWLRAGFSGPKLLPGQRIA